MANKDAPSAAEAIREDGGQLLPAGAGRWRVRYHLGGRGLTDEGLTKVAALDGVVDLNLRDTQITGAGLKHIGTLTGLRRLHLERTSVGDEGIAHLVSLGELEYLNLYSTKITDASLTHLAGLRNLKQLFVWQTGVTDAGVAKLQRALPKLKIVRGVDLATQVFPAMKEEDAVPPEKLVLMPVGVDGPPRSKTGSFIIATFKNQRKHTVKLYWVEYGGTLRFYADIAAGESREQTTYSNASWLITDADDHRIGYFRTSLKPAIAVIPAG